LKLGANPNCKDVSGYTPIMLVSLLDVIPEYILKRVCLLIEYGGDIYNISLFNETYKNIIEWSYNRINSKYSSILEKISSEWNNKNNELYDREKLLNILLQNQTYLNNTCDIQD